MWAFVVDEGDMFFSAKGQSTREGVLAERILFPVEETLFRLQPRLVQSSYEEQSYITPACDE